MSIQSVAWLILALVAGVVGTAVFWPARHRRAGGRTLLALWVAVAATVVDVLLPVAWAALAARFGAGATPLSATPIGKVTTAAALMLWAGAAVQAADLVVWHRLLARGDRSPLVPRLVVDVVGVLVLVMAGLLVVSRVFLQDLTTLLVTSTVVSAVIGLALQDVLRNVVAGLALQVEAPFARGEWVRVAGFEGRVIQMNWRTVTLLTRRNDYVILNNAKIADADIENVTRPDPVHAHDLHVGVAYPHAPGEVKRVLVDAVAGTPGVLEAPAPQPYTVAYGDFAIEYRLRVWIDDYARLLQIEDAAMTRIWYALRRAGMGIPFPIRDVNLRIVPRKAAEIEAARRRAMATDNLRRLPLFASLADEQIDAIARAADLRRYTTGEVVVHQGALGDSLYVIRSGRVRVDVMDEHGRSVTVAVREPGDVFGEMSLLTGAPRTATVVAESETEVVTVDKSAFAGVLTADPAIAERISELLAERALEIESRLAAADTDVAEARRGRREELLGRIRSFFGLNTGGSGASSPP